MKARRRQKGFPAYLGWHLTFDDSRPITGKWVAERFGVTMCAGTEEAIRSMVATRYDEERRRRGAQS